MSHWPVARLGDVLESYQPGFASGERSESGIRQLRLNNVTVDGNLDWDRSLRVPVPERGADAYMLKSGDVMFCNTNSVELVGKSAIIHALDEPTVYSNHFNRLRSKGDVLLPEWLALWLRRTWQNGVFAAECDRWIGQASFKSNKLLDLNIPLPTLLEQRRLVSAIQARTSSIAAADSHITGVRADLQSLAQQTLNQLFGSATRTVPLGQVLREVKQGIGSQWRERILYGASRAGLSLAKESIGKEPERYKPVDQETIFYNPMRILLGSIAMLPSGRRSGIASPDYVVFRCASGVLDPFVFYSWFRSPNGEQLILSLARGAVRERLLFPRLAEGIIPIPDYEEQVRARSVLWQVNEAITACDRLKIQFDALNAQMLREAFA